MVGSSRVVELVDVICTYDMDLCMIGRGLGIR